MATPFLGQISTFAFNFAPRGWAMANGQVLPINQNQALFSLLGTTYGGNGTTNFALPNLQGRVPVGSQGGTPTEGQTGGEESHTLTLAETPAHTHVVAGAAAATTTAPAKVFLGAPTTGGPYVAPPVAGAVALAASSLASAGGGQPHDNHQPYLTINACIALQGIFPSRN
ncbi:MAG TPA: tail fiber protein [Solirubrobacteraceae bacterium]|jgi:microcystin-dependent protein|nr:tail fiber protein [Solirubrobacteraceae bacterium]